MKAEDLQSVAFCIEVSTLVFYLASLDYIKFRRDRGRNNANTFFDGTRDFGRTITRKKIVGRFTQLSVVLQVVAQWH